MTSFSKKEIYLWIQKIGIIVFFTFIPFSFIKILNEEFYGIPLYPKVSHIYLLVGAVLFSFKPYRDTLVHILYKFRTFNLLFGCLLLTYILSLLWTGSPERGVEIIIKNAVYFLFFFLFATGVVEAKKNKIENYFFIGASIGVFLFLGYYYVSFYYKGFIFHTRIFELLGSGDSHYFHGQVVRAFRDFSYEFWGVDYIKSQAYNRNTVAAFLLLLLFVLNLFRSEGQVSLLKSILINFIKGVTIFLILITVSRSGLLCLSITLLVVFLLWIKFDIKKGLKISSIVLAGFTLLFVTNPSSFETLFERVFKTNVKTEIRTISAQIVFEKIKKEPLLGYGIGTKIQAVPGVNDDMIYVHNMLLGSWYMSGILSLIAATIFYLFLIYTLIKNFLNREELRKTFLNSTGWYIMLPLFPIIELTVSNFALSMTGWSFLGLFFGLSFYHQTINE